MIDPKIQSLAVELALHYPLYDPQAPNPAPIYEQIIPLEEEAEALTPLLLYSIKLSETHGNVQALCGQLDVLGHIAKDDELAYKAMLASLDQGDAGVRLHALKALAGMKQGPSAVPKIIKLLDRDQPKNRVAAIEALSRLANPSNKEAILEAVRKQRYNPDPDVRKAEEVGMLMLEGGEKP